MYHRLLMKSLIAAFVSAAAAPALAAGSDVVHYPKPEAYQSADTAEHYSLGIPAPRVRGFTNAPWANPIRPNDLRGEFRHE
jgi:hypothetical protein